MSYDAEDDDRGGYDEASDPNISNARYYGKRLAWFVGLIVLVIVSGLLRRYG